MALINGQPIQNENVEYNGKILPRDAAALADPPFDTSVVYAGQEVTQMPAKFTPVQIDLTNNPGAIIIGSVTLPNNTNILINGEKIIAESQILDGVSVFEHVSRKAYEIEFKLKLYDPNNPSYSPFPQQQITNIWNNLWTNNTIYTVQNTFLNQLNISSIIIKSIKPSPRLGSPIVDMVIKAFENQVGQSIIM
jgi:hypothetical protein